MRLSLWTQFSSNHSASFSIVGTFESPEWAQEVGSELTQMFIDTQRWEEAETVDESPAAILQQLRYDIALRHYWMLDRQHVRRALTVLDRYVFVTDHPGYSSDISSAAIIKIMRALNGRVVASLENGDYCEMMLQCSVPDDETMMCILNDFAEMKRPHGMVYYPKNNYQLLYAAARLIRHEDLTLVLEGIHVPSSGFRSVVEWIDYLKGYGCTDFKIQLSGYPEEAEPSGWIPMESLEVHRPFWSQFSYRGSKDFEPDMRVALAQFDTPIAANDAAAKVRDILQMVSEWIDQNPEQAKWVWDAFWERLSPLEMELKEKYGIRWRYSIVEWLHPIIRLRPAEDIITVIGSTMLLANRRDTWVGIEPFHQLLPHFGALKVHSLPEVRGWLTFDIEVVTKNDTQISQIIALIEQQNATTLPPWYRYYSGVVQDDAWWQSGMDALVYQAQVLAAQERLQHFWRIHKGQFEPAEKIRHLKERLLAHISETGYAATYERIRDMRFTCNAILRQKQGVLLKGVQFHIDFHQSGTLQGVLALATWLHSFGDVTLSLYRYFGGEQENYFKIVLEN